MDSGVENIDKMVINALQYKQNSSGIGVMLRELFGAFVDLEEGPVRVFLPHDGPEFPVGKNTELVRIPWDHRQGLRRMFYQTFLMGRSCKHSILLTTDSKIPFFLPKSCTVVPLITDLAVYRLPEAYQRSRVLWWRMQYHYLRRRANLFLTISEFSKGEIAACFDIPMERIHVIPCACSPELSKVEEPAQLSHVRKKFNLEKPYILFVGNNNPRKNLERVIRAFERAKEKEEDFPYQLIIAGEQGWRFNREKLLAASAYREDIRFIGFVPDEEIAALYSAASLFVFPTLYEGFGMPVLEAQSCGVPVLTSNGSSLPEVGGKGALYVDPYRTEEISAGMRRILSDKKLAEELIQAGYQNIKRFSWRSSAEKLYHLLKEEFGP